MLWLQLRFSEKNNDKNVFLRLKYFLSGNDLSKPTVFILNIQTDRQTWANSEDPDQMPPNAASDQGLHLWFASHPTVLETSAGNEILG